MEPRFVERFFQQADEIGQRIRDYNEHRITQQLEIYRREIEAEEEQKVELKTAEFNQKVEIIKASSELEVERRVKESAPKLAELKLKEDNEWVKTQAQKEFLIQRRNQRIQNFFSGFFIWLSHGSVGVFFYLLSIGSFTSLGAIMSSNLANQVACSDKNGLCYLLRLDKTTVVLPENEDARVEAYLKWYNSKKHKHK